MTPEREYSTVDEDRDRRRVYAGTTTEAVVRNVRDAPAILKRYTPFALVVALVVGGSVWWITDAVGGAVAAVGTFGVGLLLGWQLEPFLSPDRRVIAPPR